ncbi:PAS domain-containing protein [Pseudanabaenaceae cyanobacterium LEGE 13415]|nr:PAS domain-containing protein [Pseudanabaenaceae cyanobacterium LEGE 13415]
MEDQTNLEIEALLDYIKRSRGFDFTGYKRPSLLRRINRAMQNVGIEGYSNYLDYLEVHPEEFVQLFNTLLINVTCFFRDRPAWDFIRSEIIPKILEQKSSKEPIRVWTAGCASGQEAYTVAILLTEILGVKLFRDRVKIYATDVDEEALNQARQAVYAERELSGLTPEQIGEFFEKSDSHYTFRKDLRQSVIFGRHDLIQDAPISRIDLLTCRNTLMYFNAETQAKILSRFHFSLKDGGFLFLGKAEMLLSHASTFTPVQLRCRVFSKVPRAPLRDRPLTTSRIPLDDMMSFSPSFARLRELVFETAPVARLVIDGSGFLALVNERARSLFGISQRDVGRPLQDLEISYRPVELRSCIEQVCVDRRSLTLCNVEWQTMRESIYLDVQITPLIDLPDTILGISVSFTDVTRYKRLQEELEHSNQELEMAYEELQSTNEELETTNEELQLSNEELETTNEELQSTNEELETMNEELQSTNEELQTVNAELQRRSEELNQSNSFLEWILRSLKGGVVVVDRDIRIQIWNHKAEDLWGIRSEEAIDQNFLNLDIGLPVEQLRQPIRECLLGLSETAIEVMLAAINRRGRSIDCYVTSTPLMSSEGSIQGVILLMEERSTGTPTSS